MELSAGIFILMLGMGLLSIFISFKGGVFGTVFRMLAAIIFFGISMILFAGYDVTYSEITTNGETTLNSTKFLIGNTSETMDSMSQPLGWLFLSIGVILSLIFLTDAFRGNI